MLLTAQEIKFGWLPTNQTIQYQCIPCDVLVDPIAYPKRLKALFRI